MTNVIPESVGLIHYATRIKATASYLTKIIHNIKDFVVKVGTMPLITVPWIDIVPVVTALNVATVNLVTPSSLDAVMWT